MKRNTSIFISHAWGGISDEILAQLVKRLEAEEITFILDKRDLSYRQSIRDFMVQLGEADMVIIILSNKYLKSEYCMFELLEIHKNENLNERIFPIVLDEVKISSSADRLEFVKYWETQLLDLQNKVKELNSLSYIEGITDDLNLYSEIRNNIARLTGILRDINTLNITIHRESDYEDLVKAIKSKISGQQEKKPLPVNQSNSGLPLITSDNLKRTAFIVFALFGVFMAWGILTKSNIFATHQPADSGNLVLLDSTSLNESDITSKYQTDSSSTGMTVVPDTFIKEETSTSPKKSAPEIQKSAYKTQNQPPSKNSITSTSIIPEKIVEKEYPDPVPSSSAPTQEKVSEIVKPKLTTTIPKGTELLVKTSATISSDDSFPLPRRVTFVLDKPLTEGKNIVLPAGSLVSANITFTKSSNYKRAGVIDIVFEYLKAPDGQKILLQSNEFHLIAKGDVPMEINPQSVYKIKTSSTTQIQY